MSRLLLAASAIALPWSLVSPSAVAAGFAGGPPLRINEVRIDQPGADNDEYFELRGVPGASLDGVTYIVIGDLSGATPPAQNGGVEFVLDLTGNALDGNGLFLVAKSTFSLPGTPNLIAPLNFENFDNVTHLIVSNFTGAVGDDLDPNDDGVLEVTPWDAILDSIALVAVPEPDGITSDFYYSDVRIGPDAGTVPGHAWLCRNVDLWQIGPYDVTDGEDTPGQPNFECAAGGGVTISEVRIDQPGADVDEYFELAAEPGTSLDGLTYIVIGDGTGGSGVVECVVPLDGFSAPASGYFLAAKDDNTLGVVADLITDAIIFENSDNVTHMLVRGFTGAIGDDLDTDDDCTLDVTPWEAIVDSIALVETFGSGDCIYSDNTVGPDGPFVPGHAYTCEPDGTWTVGVFDVGVTDTPGAPNLPCTTDICGGYDGRSCFAPHSTGGCSDPRVCDLVCAIDPTCCDTAWDKGCVATAQATVFGTTAPEGLAISEVRIKQPGGDNDHYIEITGTPGTVLDGVSYLVLGDEGADASGTVEYILNLTGVSIPASGYLVIAESTFTLGTADFVWPINFEDVYNQTHLLVFNFNGAAGGDYDVENDCVLDATPWASVLDSVSVIGSTGCTYADDTVGPDTAFTPGHFYRCTPKLAWAVGAFDPTAGTDTPGFENLSCTATLSCGDPSAGSCLEPNGTPYCSDGACCEAVCAVDPACCNVEWDQACADSANILCVGGPTPPAVVINEVRIDQTGPDNDEYFELRGEAGASLTGLTYIVLGDGNAEQASGVVEVAVSLLAQSMPKSGFFLAAEETFTLATPNFVTTLDFENGDTVTHMLVWNFTGAVGDDLDPNDDGVLDITPWDEIVDSIALVISTDVPPPPGADWFYGGTTVGPDGAFVPGHAYRCSDSGPWTVGPFDVVAGVDTPGAPNTPCAETPCTGDLNDDGVVNGADLAILLGEWGKCPGCVADLNGDGVVNGADLAILLGAWGECP